MKFNFKIGDKVIATSGRFLGSLVTIKSIIPATSEVLIEDFFGNVQKVTLWDIEAQK